MTDQEKAERYDLIVGYFQNILNKRADGLLEEMICYDGERQPHYMDETEREESATETFLNEMDNIGFYDFAELMAHEVYGNCMSFNNQFYDHVYGEQRWKTTLLN